MPSFRCLVSWIPSLSQESGRIFFLGNRGFIDFPCTQKQQTRGAKTDAPIQDSILLGEEDDPSAEDERIQKIRDISGLRPSHRNIANRVLPSEEKTLPHEFTVRYNKKMFGRYGYESGVNPSICWPSKYELEDKKEYESVAYPYTIAEVAERERAKKKQLEEERMERDKQITENVKKMLKLKEEFIQRQEKHRADTEAAKAFKTRLIEEVRLHFNYTVNERDEKFRLELKERARQLKEKEKLSKKTSKKEKLAEEKAAKFEYQKKKLLEEEAKRAAKKAEEL
ncbi:growth arrest and DNA damage-inducible proteins-interacting protein 1 [Thrips palmi]|uniref:Large ribosomal subunit protein mL64 n=1 Tax=Thrips palmi TaxID=161013 RepID=A0A6P8ZXC8_THRPL|nr:growth arrest and DNA damage-inducible proteins-interacting protein 1 [Thrips palmi]